MGRRRLQGDFIMNKRKSPKGILGPIFFVLLIIFFGFIYLKSGRFLLHALLNRPSHGVMEKAMQNFQSDLVKAEDEWKHNRKGREYFEAGDYEKAIGEYLAAIQEIQAEPNPEHPASWTKEEVNTTNEWIKTFRQEFPRHRLVEVYEKAGHYQEAIEQIDWLLTHKPLAHVWYSLTNKKQELLYKLKPDQGKEWKNSFFEQFKYHMELSQKYRPTSRENARKSGQEFQKAIAIMKQDPIYQEKFGNK